MKPTSTLFYLSILILTIPTALFSQQTENWLERSDPIPFPKLYLQTDREVYFQGDSVWFKAYYLNGQTQQLIPGAYSLYADLVNENGLAIERKVLLLDNGLSAGKIEIPDSLETGNYVLRAFTDFQRSIGEDAFFHKTLKITSVKSSIEKALPNFSGKRPEIEVAFLPEGGFLLAGHMNTMGVKALDENGFGISLQGEILDVNGDVVTRFATEYKGMDSFQFSPRKGKNYNVKIKGYPDYDYQFNDIAQEGIKIEYTGESNDNLLFKISTNLKSFQGEVYYFAIMHRGRVISHQKFVQKNKYFPIKVNRYALPAGINRFVLLDDHLKPISERLHFSNNFEVNDVKIRSNQKTYEPRSEVQLEIFDEEEIGDVSFSNLSVAVVDANAVGENGPEQNILSWLLIESELKGTVESPTDYFIDDENISSKDKLNLLMLTQGWSRYLWTTISEQSADPDFKLVEGISLEGTVKHALTKKPIDNGDVELKIYNSDHFISTEGKTDENGRFTFDNISFSDIASVFIQARNKRGKLSTVIDLDTIFERNPSISKNYLPTTRKVILVSDDLYEQQYYNELDLRNFVLESGSILLEEVKIVGQKRENDDGHPRIYPKPKASFKLTNRDLSYRNVFEYLQGRTTGLVSGQISFQDGASELFCLLDGNIVSQEVIENLPMSDIDVVEVLKHYYVTEVGIFGVSAGIGGVAVFTKEGNDIGNDPYSPGTLTKRIAGYSSYREFYAPSYTPENIDSEKPDHRLTLYWNPSLNTEQGKVSVSFFTSDDITRYKIFVEGVTQIGEICLGISEMVVCKDHLNRVK
ncbi:MAG: hypothetical protein KAR19_15775 [Bacteroidales bacterium]|nr:hypothetical protein [Bacteroidales bacterium]